MADEAKPVGVINWDLFSQVDLRVGTIEHAEAIPNKDRLVKLQVNLGEMGTRQIVAGIKVQYPPEKLLGVQVVVVTNLEPRKLGGEMSHGMLLAASNADHSDLALVTLDRKFAPGSKVS